MNVSSSDVCLAVNVTITPTPFTVAQEGQNITLTCVVSQRRRNAALPVVKWSFLPAGTERPEDELLIARVNMRKARFYGNYTKSFLGPKMKLTVVKQGKVFDLLILNVSQGDRGLYLCRVQEFKKHQDRWKASSNSTAATELRGEGWISSLVATGSILLTYLGGHQLRNNTSCSDLSVLSGSTGSGSIGKL